jgi:ketosteroid isomerase-like protein
VRAAISGAQRGEVAYPEFVRRTVAAGCVGYDAWLAGRHVVYHGRRGEQWVERFPGAAPSPRPAVALVREIYDAFARRDVAAAFARFADDIEILQSREVAWGGHHRGHDGARTFFAGLLAALDSTLELERLIDAGDHVVAIGRTRGVERTSGRRYDVPIAHVWTVRDGLAARAEFFIDNITMLAAIDPRPHR